MEFADVEGGVIPRTTAAEGAESRAARRRARLREVVSEVLCSAAAHLSQANVRGKAPLARAQTSRGWDSRLGQVWNVLASRATGA